MEKTSGLAFWFVAVIATTSAIADPLHFRLRGSVLRGEKPQIEVTADSDVADVRIDLERDDRKKLALRPGALAKGKVITLAIGDGALGKARYRGTISAKAGGQTWSQPLEFETSVAEPIKVTYDADHLDVDKGLLQFKTSRPIGSAQLVVIGDDGRELARVVDKHGDDLAQSGWLTIKWTPVAGARVLKLSLRVDAGDGAATNVELIPWSVTIEHEDVNFATDSAAIEPAEATKLDASVAKIEAIIKQSAKFVAMKLYVAGHTDTVGGAPANRKLSLARARAIASYFRTKGIALPIAIAGFGEDVPRVATPDNTDERANRRADYVLGPVGAPPPFRGAYLKVKAGWTNL